MINTRVRSVSFLLASLSQYSIAACDDYNHLFMLNSDNIVEAYISNENKEFVKQRVI